jgi:hypothetical protein
MGVRATNDTTLQANIDTVVTDLVTEAAVRLLVDTGLTDAVSTLQSALTTESVVRLGVDTSLTGVINTVQVDVQDNTDKIQNMGATPSNTTFAGVVGIGDYSLSSTGGFLRATHTDGGSMMIGMPLINSGGSHSTCHIDYSGLVPSFMRANVNSSGGYNRCWGQTATYIADVNLLGGRLVALADQSNDMSGLRVQYMDPVANALAPAVTPVGITQHDVLAGGDVIVCIHGYTTAVCANGNNSVKRGSIVLGSTTVDGRIRTGVAPAAVQSRIGFCAQSDNASANSGMLIHYSGFFQAT